VEEQSEPAEGAAIIPAEKLINGITEGKETIASDEMWQSSQGITQKWKEKKGQ
jgi:hypothetical protein